MERTIVRRSIAQSVVADSFNEQRFNTLFGCKPRVIPYGIDWKFFSEIDPAGNVREELDLAGQFVILHVGMLTPLRTSFAALELVARLKPRIADILLVLAGVWNDDYKKK